MLQIESSGNECSDEIKAPQIIIELLEVDVNYYHLDVTFVKTTDVITCAKCIISISSSSDIPFSTSPSSSSVVSDEIRVYFRCSKLNTTGPLLD